jgi:hypothetical protein
MARNNKDYDRTRRDKDSTAFYKSIPWLTVRGEVLRKYHGLDIYKLMVEGVLEYADTVHHIWELKERPDLSLSLENLIPMSAGTHSYIHKLYKQDKNRVINELLYILDTFDVTRLLTINGGM